MTISAAVSGAAKAADSIHARVSGAWKKCIEAYVRVAGAWRRVHAIPTIAYRERRHSLGNLTAYPFGAVDIGAASEDRVTFIFVNGSHVSASGRSVSSVVIDGVGAATRLVGAQGAGSGTLRAEIWAIEAPASVLPGSTPDMAVVWSGQMENCSIATYRAAGLNSVTPRATAASPSPATGGRSVAIDTFEDGILLACWHYGDDAATSWVGVSEDFDVEGTTLRRNAGASASGLTAQTGRIVAATPGGGGSNAAALAVVSMR